MKDSTSAYFVEREKGHIIGVIAALYPDAKIYLVKFIDMRNETSPIYDAAMAESASRNIIEHYAVLRAVVMKLGELLA